MRTVTLVTTVAVAATSLWLVPVARAADGDGPAIRPVAGSWRDVLQDAVAAAASVSYEASMVVVTLGADGPGVMEAELRKGRDGDLAVSVSESWLIARTDDDAMLRKDGAPELLHVGQVHALPFTIAELERNYDVALEGRAELATGPAHAVTIHRRGTLRERLFVDTATHLVVRRETYGGDGSAARVTALTELQVSEVAMEPLDGSGEDAMGERIRLDPDDVLTMQGHEWPVPTTVGDAFDLRAGFDVAGAAAVQLVYSDGLYTVSLLEQPGSLDPDALSGATREVHRGVPLYRWPGVQPLRVVWNGDGHTFTAVTDAPTDVLLDVIGDLPHDTEPSMPSRLRRGLARLGDWLWPFS